MSHTNRNFILAYTFLVALPVLGLVGILKSGRRLTAPISVDGQWQLQADPVRLAALPCAKTLAEGPDTALVISQSGKNFTVSLSNNPKSTGSGELDGTTLRAALAPSAAWSDDATCGTDRELSLVAKVDAKADPRSLVGTLSVSHCPECTAVEFHAVHQSPPVRKGLH